MYGIRRVYSEKKRKIVPKIRTASVLPFGVHHQVKMGFLQHATKWEEIQRKIFDSYWYLCFCLLHDVQLTVAKNIAKYLFDNRVR